VVLSGPGAQPIVAPVSTQNSELVCMHMCTIDVESHFVS
jgi:hypothetical protein